MHTRHLLDGCDTLDWCWKKCWHLGPWHTETIDKERAWFTLSMALFTSCDVLGWSWISESECK